MRAAWQAYEAANLPLLRMEKPGLKQSQYRDMLWKSWQKAPENPVRAVAVVGGGGGGVEGERRQGKAAREGRCRRPPPLRCCPGVGRQPTFGPRIWTADHTLSLPRASHDAHHSPPRTALRAQMNQVKR